MSKPHLSTAAAELADPRPTPRSLWARCYRLADRAGTFAPLLATLIAFAALGTSLIQLTQSRRAIRDQTVADLLHQSSQILMWAANDPEAYTYFERALFGHGQPRRSLADLARADRATRMRVQIVCETLADFFESTYDGRAAFDAPSWNAWWAYMSNVYDESAVLRQYLRQRGDWYDIDDALASQTRRIALRR